MNTITNDLKFALRQLRRSPALALTAVLTLALGIGANTAIFSLLDQALLRSLPVRDPKQLVVLEGTGTAWQGHFMDRGGDPQAYFSYPMYKDLRDRNSVFSGLIATGSTPSSFTYNNSSQLVDTEIVSGNYFTMLGVAPSMGRLFTQAEDSQKDANPVAVLSYDFWKTRLGADPTIVGSNVTINGHGFQVVGVSGRGFRSAVWGETPGLFVPMSMAAQIAPGEDARITDHKERWINIIGRLKPGVSRAQAQAAMNPLWHALRADELKALGNRSKYFTDDFLTNSRMILKPGASGFSYSRDTYQKPLIAVMAMAALVLLIASVNVASLLLVRSAGRVREFSLRYALGANGSRILQQLILEGMLIGIAGGVAGLALTPFALHVLVSRLTDDTGAVAFTSSINTTLLLFNFAVALGVSLIFSLAPLIQLRRPDLASTMNQRGATGAGSLLSFRRAIVCLQIGLSVVMLVGAALFLRTMQNLRAVNVGFNTSHLITFGVDPLLAGYTPQNIPALHDRIIDTLSALPGVQSVASTDDPELAENGAFTGVRVSGYVTPPDDNFSVERPSVSPNFFSTMQLPLIAGRAFTPDDDLAHPRVAIVNEAFVQHFCSSINDCLGRSMAFNGSASTPVDTQIVGVVRDARHTGIREPVVVTAFRPIKQTADHPEQFLYFYLRTVADPAQELPTIRAAMQHLDPSLALVSLLTLQGQIDETLTNDRMVTLLAISFGVLATFLAGVGLYGVLAYSTAQRTREIGIRIALGSTRLGISGIVLGDVLKLAALGIVIALPVAFGLSRLLRSQLYGVSPADPVSLILAVFVIAAVAFIAALIPATRAASINPTEALRTE
jgi:putative ABC transport system permease protein